MKAEHLTVSILFATGVPRPEIMELLEGFPQLRLLGQGCDPQSFQDQHQGIHPDLVLVEMDGANQVPPWMEQLTETLPQSSVMICSHNREPEFLIRAMQIGVREFLPLPLTHADLEATLQRVRVAKKRLQPADDRQGRLIVVTGHKGGCGSTTIAVNLGMALAELGAEGIALVDLGRPFPDVANFLDQEATYSIADLIHNLSNLDQSFIQRIMQSYGGKLSILHGIADFREQDIIDLEAMDKILGILRSQYQYIIVDLSHWLDDLFLHLIAEADLVLLLTGLTVPDLRNLKKLWPMLLEWHHGNSQVKIVINRYDNNNGLRINDLEHVVQQPAYFILPNDYLVIMEALNQGSYLGMTAPRSKLWRSLMQLAAQVKKAIPYEAAAELAAPAAPRRRFWLF